MASKTIGVLRAEASVNADGFARDMEACRSAAQNIGKRIESNFESMGRSITRSVKSLLDFRGVISGITVASLGYMMRASLEAADALAKTADAAGVSTASLQEYRYAAELSGIGSEKLDASLKFFAKTLGETRQGSGSLAEKLRDINPALLALVRSSATTDQALSLVLGAMGKLENASDRAALAAAAFGKSAGVDMAVMVKDGAAGIEEMRQRARDLGLVMDEELVRKAERAKDTLETLSAVLRTQLSQSILETIPNVDALGDKIARAIPKAVQSVKDTLKTLPGAASAIGLWTAVNWPSQAAPPAAPRQAPPAWNPSDQEAVDKADAAVADEVAQKIRNEISAREKAQKVIESTWTAQQRLQAEEQRLMAMKPQLIMLLGSEAAAQDVINKTMAADKTKAYADARGIIESTWTAQQRVAAAEAGYMASKPQLIALLGSEAAAQNAINAAMGEVRTKAYAEAKAIIDSTLTSEQRMSAELAQIQSQRANIVVLTGSEARAAEVLAKAENNVKTSYQRVGQFAQQAHVAIASGLTEAILQGKTFDETLKAIAQDLARIAIQMMMMRAVGTAMGMPGYSLSAKGNVFSSGRVVPFATGAVIHSPIVFPMRRGFGMAGEAGPEAIMPLTRIGGNLGVRAQVQRSEGFVFHQYVSIEGSDFGDLEVIRRILDGISQHARMGTSEVLQASGLLRDLGDLNNRRAV